MFIRFLNGQCNGVFQKEPKDWDTETQVGMEIDETSYPPVNTPDGEMSFADALWKRTGAFSLVDDEIVHNENLVVEE